MRKFTWMLGALALAIGPAMAGGCDECEDCEEECVECCSPEEAAAKIDAELDAAQKARVEAAEAFQALPEEQRKAVKDAMAVIVTECPGAKAGMASMGATLRLLSIACAIDKATGAADTPRAKLLAKARTTLVEMCKAMGSCGACPKTSKGCTECAKSEGGCCEKCAAAAKDPKALVQAAAEARKAAAEARVAMAAAPAAMEAAPEEAKAKVMKAYEVASECPCFQAMTRSMGAVAMAVLFLNGQKETPAEGAAGDLAAARDGCVADAAALLESCGGCCDDDDACGDDEEDEDEDGDDDEDEDEDEEDDDDAPPVKAAAAGKTN